MASISCALARIKQQLETLIPESFIEETLRTLGVKWRKRRLSPAINVYLLLLQFLAASTFERLRHVSGLTITPRPCARHAKGSRLSSLWPWSSSSAGSGRIFRGDNCSAGCACFWSMA